MGNKHAQLITWVLLIVLILSSWYAVYIIKKDFIDSFDAIRTQATINQIPTEPKSGYTPIKGVDYYDGKDGQDGKDSVSNHTETTIIKEVPLKGIDGIDGKDGENGKTPDIQCNPKKNRWEVRYNKEDQWKILGESPVKCTLERLL